MIVKALFPHYFAARLGIVDRTVNGRGGSIIIISSCTKVMRFWMRYLRIPPSRPPIASSTFLSNHNKQRDFLTDLPLRKQSSSSSFSSLSTAEEELQRHARRSVTKNLPAAPDVMIDTAAYNDNAIHSLDASINTVPNWLSWEAETPTLRQFTDAMNFLYQEHDSITNDNKRRYLCIDVIRLVMSAKASIQQGKIRPMSGKDRYALTDCLGLAMLVYSKTQPTTLGEMSNSNAALSPYEASLDVIDILRSLNIDILPTHYTCAIRAACNESRWSDATSLLFSQIDGNDNADGMATGGFTPIDANLAWEGLYAVAMKMAMEKEAGLIKESTSKVVFDTAMKMCMISPEGQKQYILAAGKALGRAGLWKDCVDFATDSTSITLYGPSIVAAAMQACNACSRFDDTISVYDYFMSGNRSAASEWQWGGGDITAIKPLCRDLALYAMGNDEKGGHSKRAMSLFAEIIDEGYPVRSNTLLSLAHSMELDGQWQSSFNLLKAIPSLEIDVSDMNTGEIDNLHTDILASVMRVCNSGGQHGLAIFASTFCNSEHMTNSDKHDNSQISQATIQSIYGLGCGVYANEFWKELQTDVPHLFRHNYSSHRESWINAFVAIDRVLKVINTIRLEEKNISTPSHVLFERGLTRAMEHCIDSGQPASALELYLYTNTFLTKHDESLTQRVKTLFGMESTQEGSDIFHLSEMNIKEMTVKDPLLATIIKAYSKLGPDPRKTLSIYDDGTIRSGESIFLSQSINNVLEAKLDIDVNEGLRFFKAMDPKSVNPTSFCVIANRYAERGIWHEIGDVYNRARSAGCINEDLGLIAMQAVCKSELLEGKIVTLRRIVDDVCGLSLMKSNDWIKLHYWTIRKNIGFHYARVCMCQLFACLYSLSYI